MGTQCLADQDRGYPRMGLLLTPATLSLLLALLFTATIVRSRQIYLSPPAYYPYHPYTPMVYYQPLLPPAVPNFKIEVSKPLEKEDGGVVVLESEGEVTDLADEVDIIELTEDEKLECLTAG